MAARSCTRQDLLDSEACKAFDSQAAPERACFVGGVKKGLRKRQLLGVQALQLHRPNRPEKRLSLGLIVPYNSPALVSRPAGSLQRRPLLSIPFVFSAGGQ